VNFTWSDDAVARAATAVEASSAARDSDERELKRLSSSAGGAERGGVAGVGVVRGSGEGRDVGGGGDLSGMACSSTGGKVWML
jgi:hypothetical protein